MPETAVKTRPSTTAQDDTSLITDFLAGDRTAFNRLVLRYQDLIVNLCVRLTGNRHDGEDAAQETFVKAFRGLSKFKGVSSFSTWLYQIGINTCRNRQRSWWSRLKKRSVDLDDPIETDDGARTRELGDTRFSPEKDLERMRLGAAIQQALAKLPAKQREVVVLRDIEGHSYEEIEKMVGVSLGTVKSRLARAREALQHELKDFCHGA